MVVYYIPPHLSNKLKNAEKGKITQIKDGNVWVKYNGPQGNLTPIRDLYV
jgi:hypothetical protein